MHQPLHLFGTPVSPYYLHVIDREMKISEITKVNVCFAFRCSKHVPAHRNHHINLMIAMCSLLLGTKFVLNQNDEWVIGIIIINVTIRTGIFRNCMKST